MSKVVLFGAGQTAEIVHHYFTHDSPHEVVAFTADGAFIRESTFRGLPVVPFESLTASHPPESFDLFVALSYDNINRLRAEKYHAAKAKGYRLVNYVSSAIGTPGALTLGDNCLILENPVIQPFVTIGSNVFIWGGALIGHHTVIGDHCWIVSDAGIGGNARIGPGCFIGINATIGHMVSIGAECLVGAGVLVNKDAPDKSVFIAKNTEPYPLNIDRFLRITRMR